MKGLTVIAPVAPIVKYETVRYNLTPVVDGPFVGYGVDVDKAWDSIANDSKPPSSHTVCCTSRLILTKQWATK